MNKKKKMTIIIFLIVIFDLFMYSLCLGFDRSTFEDAVENFINGPRIMIESRIDVNEIVTPFWIVIISFIAVVEIILFLYIFMRTYSVKLDKISCIDSKEEKEKYEEHCRRINKMKLIFVVLLVFPVVINVIIYVKGLEYIKINRAEDGTINSPYYRLSSSMQNIKDMAEEGLIVISGVLAIFVLSNDILVIQPAKENNINTKNMKKTIMIDLLIFLFLTIVYLTNRTPMAKYWCHPSSVIDITGVAKSIIYLLQKC